MNKLIYCANCALLQDCEQAEYCGCCYDGIDYTEDTENGNETL